MMDWLLDCIFLENLLLFSWDFDFTMADLLFSIENDDDSEIDEMLTPVYDDMFFTFIILALGCCFRDWHYVV